MIYRQDLSILTAYFMVIFNCSVHVFMYFYYFLAACGPSMQRFLGWKRLVTILQMVCVFTHSLCLDREIDITEAE